MKRLLVKWILTLICLLVWLPILMILGNSLMSKGELYQRFSPVLGVGSGDVKPCFLPSYPTLEPYFELLLDSPGFFVMFWNSCIQVFLTLAGQLLVAVPAAWAFASFTFKGKKLLFFLYVVLMILPFQVTMAPNYLVLSRLGLIDHHLAVILPGVFSAFPVFIMTRFFEEIPTSLVEAARLDGAGEWAVFTKIGIPMGLPGLVAAMLLGFLEYWNAIEQPMTFLKDKRLWPLSLYLPEITTDKVSVAWTASVIVMILPVLLFFLGQSFLEQGICASGIKE